MCPIWADDPACWTPLCAVLHSARVASPTRSGARDTGARGPRRALPAQSHEALLVLGAAVLEDVDALADRLTVMVLQREPVYSDMDMVEELRTACLEAGVKLIACQMTLDLFEFDKTEFIDGIEFGGAATFLQFAGKSDVTLFI